MGSKKEGEFKIKVSEKKPTAPLYFSYQVQIRIPKSIPIITD